MAAILLLHGLWRWAVLIAAVLAVTGALTSMRDSAGVSRAQRFGFWYTLALDLQVTLGLILWVGEMAWRFHPFLAFIHPAAMLAGLGLAHVARSRQRKLVTAGRPSMVPLALYIASLAVLVLAIPTGRV